MAKNSSNLNYLSAYTNSKTYSPILSIVPNEPTASQVWGPFFVLHAPFRCKLSPTGSKGDTVLISGRVYGLDSKKGIPFACIDLWQDDSETGEYDYYEPDEKKHAYREELNTHGAAKNFNYRARTITDETGYYEFETNVPIPYFDPEDSTWRTAHIHYFIQHPQYQSVVTQLYFEGNEKNSIDRHIRKDATIKLEEKEFKNGTKYKVGSFNLYLKQGTPALDKPPYKKTD